jgi:iron complex transport system permease protein
MRVAPRTQALGLGVIAAIAGAAALLRLFVDRDPSGAVSLAWPEPHYAWVRWNALAVGAAAGSALGVSGTVLQAMLRNPLASPSILGVSAGAGLGVMIATLLRYSPDVPPPPGGWTQGACALAGALGTLAIVYALSQRRGWLDPLSLVLIGVIVSSMCGALTLFLHHLVPTGLMHGEITRWMLGRIDESVAGTTLAAVGTLAVAGTALATLLGRAMDAATLGDDEARTIGLALPPLRVALFCLAGALTAGSVALCGPIAFVGLIAPHAARLLLGPKHTPLVVGSALLGVALVVGSDTARQALDLGAGRIPIGVFTALLGGPAFIWLLRSGRGQA